MQLQFKVRVLKKLKTINVKMDENSTIGDLKKYLIKNLVDFNVPLDTQVVMF